MSRLVILCLLAAAAGEYVTEDLFISLDTGCVQITVGTRSRALRPSFTDSVWRVGGAPAHYAAESPTFDPLRRTDVFFVGRYVMRLPVLPYDGGRGCEGVLPLGAASPLWLRWRYLAVTGSRLVLTNDVRAAPEPLASLALDGAPLAWTVEGAAHPFPVRVDLARSTVLLPLVAPLDHSEIVVTAPYHDVMHPGRNPAVFRYDPVATEIVLGAAALDQFVVVVDWRNGSSYAAPRVCHEDGDVHIVFNGMTSVVLMFALAFWWVYKVLAWTSAQPFAELQHGLRAPVSRAVLLTVFVFVVLGAGVHLSVNLGALAWAEWLCLGTGICHGRLLFSFVFLAPVALAALTTVACLLLGLTAPLVHFTVEYALFTVLFTASTPLQNQVLEYLVWNVAAIAWVWTSLIEAIHAALPRPRPHPSYTVVALLTASAIVLVTAVTARATFRRFLDTFGHMPAFLFIYVLVLLVAPVFYAYAWNIRKTLDAVPDRPPRAHIGNLVDFLGKRRRRLVAKA